MWATPPLPSRQTGSSRNSYMSTSFCGTAMGPVEGVCRVCVVDGWFTASPGLSQTDWTLAGWGCTPGVHEQSWHPRINQPSTHTLEEEPLSWPEYHQLGEYQLPENSNKHLCTNIYPCPVSEGPKRKPLRWRVEEQPCHRAKLLLATDSVVVNHTLTPWETSRNTKFQDFYYHL